MLILPTHFATQTVTCLHIYYGASNGKIRAVSQEGVMKFYEDETAFGSAENLTIEFLNILRGSSFRFHRDTFI